MLQTPQDYIEGWLPKQAMYLEALLSNEIHLTANCVAMPLVNGDAVTVFSILYCVPTVVVTIMPQIHFTELTTVPAASLSQLGCSKLA
jgi:hypothetical protein